MHARVVLGVGKSVLFREVSSVQECPHRERERFHCILYPHLIYCEMKGFHSHSIPQRALRLRVWTT